MDSITITANDAYEGLLRIVRAEPNRKGVLDPEQEGSGCAYAKVEHGVLVASCIVGQYFANIGLLGLLVTDPTLAVSSYRDEPSQHGACNIELFENLAVHGVTVEPEAQTLFQFVQRQQDDGKVWASAFAEGVKAFHESQSAALASSRWVTASTEVLHAAQDTEPLADWERELLNA